MENNRIPNETENWYESQIHINEENEETILGPQENSYSLTKDEIQEFQRSSSIAPIIYENKIKPDIVIIGAGPVGLWTSIKIKENKPDLNILIYERHKIYQRANLIKLSDPKEFNIDNNSSLIKLFKTKMISILEIESVLLEEATKHNVNICYETVDNIDNLYNRHPEAKLWIACDGAHSKIRNAWYKSDAIYENLFNIIQVTYNTVDTAKKLNIHKRYKILKKLNCIVEESVESNKVFLRFFVDKEIFESIKHFTMKNPCLSFKLIENEKVREYIQFWLRYRKYYLDENGVPDSFKLTCFKLDAYRSPNFSHFDNDRLNILVGDSAFGVPFYRSMRNGWIASNELIKIIFSNWENPKAISTAYNTYMNEFYTKEKKRANNKTKGLNLASLWINVSSIVPWQISFVTKKKEKEINSINLDFLV